MGELGKTFFSEGFTQLGGTREPGLRLIGLFAFAMLILTSLSVVALAVSSFLFAYHDKEIPRELFYLAGGGLLLLLVSLVGVLITGWRHGPPSSVSPPLTSALGLLREQLAAIRRTLETVRVRIRKEMAASDARKSILSSLTRSIKGLEKVEKVLTA